MQAFLSDCILSRRAARRNPRNFLPALFPLRNCRSPKQCPYRLLLRYPKKKDLCACLVRLLFRRQVLNMSLPLTLLLCPGWEKKQESRCLKVYLRDLAAEIKEGRAKQKNQRIETLSKAKGRIANPVIH